ncbi:protein of unknown function [Methanoculleus bourgensis]|uniref:Uncharacterized protein n=1 Tax=Methanoculleus bourgensis TaxID=83986 RepID=A0A0X3BMA0_9EURY|nr:protein of unknown function [Methanoculleus bourgensis]
MTGPRCRSDVRARDNGHFYNIIKFLYYWSYGWNCLRVGSPKGCINMMQRVHRPRR